ncbi:MAG: tRNA pseudouridine(55) synthase TruB [Acidimicrobiia bacterium]
MLDGLLVVDKPAGCTSHDVVARVRKAAGQRKVGHAGTLDPDATGVLLVGLGRATRLMRFLSIESKSYRCDVVFGVATDTLDAAGRVVDRRPMAIDREAVVTASERFIGEIDQVPPMVSAVKIGGRRLHEIARAGEEIERAPRRVRIDRIEVEALEQGPYPVATVVVECGSGTYIRTLAADLGAALGGFAHVGALRRLSVGSFTLDEAHPLDEIETDLAGMLLAPREAVRDLEAVAADDGIARAVAHGSVFPAAALPVAPDASGPFAVVGPDGSLLAVYERRGAALKPAVVVST